MQSLFLVDAETTPMPQRDLGFRIQTAEENINRLRERAAALEGRLTPTQQPPTKKEPNAVLIGIVITIALMYSAWLGVEVVGIGKDVASLKTSVGDLQRAQASAYLNSAEQEARAGDKITAKRHIEQASLLLERLTSSPVPAPAFFFEQSAEKLDLLSSSIDYPSETHQAFVRLAEYRSALQIAHHFNGMTFNCKWPFKSKGMFQPVGDLSKADRIVNSVIITNCPQQLDGFNWQNVVFVNDHISYNGGPVVLDNVRFIHCTFETPQSDDGVRILQYAALDEKALKVKPEFFGKTQSSGL